MSGLRRSNLRGVEHQEKAGLHDPAKGPTTANGRGAENMKTLGPKIGSRLKAVASRPSPPPTRKS